MSESDIPVGLRLGSERLYDEFTQPPEPPPPPEPDPAQHGNSLFSDAIRHYRDRQAAKQPPTAPKEQAAQGNTADRNWREIISNALEVAGLGVITAGCWTIATWLGLIVLGVGLILLGVLITLPRNQ